MTCDHWRAHEGAESARATPPIFGALESKSEEHVLQLLLLRRNVIYSKIFGEQQTAIEKIKRNDLNFGMQKLITSV